MKQQFDIGFLNTILRYIMRSTMDTDAVVLSYDDFLVNVYPATVLVYSFHSIPSIPGIAAQFSFFLYFLSVLSYFHTGQFVVQQESFLLILFSTCGIKKGTTFSAVPIISYVSSFVVTTGHDYLIYLLYSLLLTVSIAIVSLLMQSLKPMENLPHGWLPIAKAMPTRRCCECYR